MARATLPRRPRARAKRVFAIVASRFNDKYVQGLIDHALAELRLGGGGNNVVVHRVPGAFEIPVLVRELALHEQLDAILAIAVILHGETDHAQHLARSVTDALQRIAVDYGVPVINCVLSMDSEDHARERCLGVKINRGTEAARAALEIAGAMAQLRCKN